MKMQVLMVVQANHVAIFHQITKQKFEKGHSLVPTATQKGEPPLPLFSTFTLRLKKLDK